MVQHMQINKCTTTILTELREFIFLASKITAESDCSHEIKRHLLLGRKAVTNLDSVLESRDVTLLTKIHKIRAVAFPLAM